ncbi:hypothetical protein D2E52_15615 [Mycobacteroides abscessus]|uniref:Uncharacterized protein n=1 Tax=Mycobacteroides abscessus TaxID=36809 RepID=A0ABD7HHW5_9MYCO|nr:hypothetical protein DDJ37_11930 [Mycobacteroides abscessus]PVA76694.1 hypothetical protein DDJ76_19050 [Mycobacteroides abscessus]PVB21712.1 hypothetical protein DDJ71_16050 [Mycobacteroides abscessus]RIQ84514.1 hypothetical protein D2E32_11885 [Mycobacteroides abscessus]RIR04516.1 hypothetical protein D2E35_09655 [Mycobacteroides abscessus]
MTAATQEDPNHRDHERQPRGTAHRRHQPVDGLCDVHRVAQDDYRHRSRLYQFQRADDYAEPHMHPVIGA